MDDKNVVDRMIDDLQRAARPGDKLREMAASGPPRPRIAAVTEQPVTPIGAAAVSQRLEELMEAARYLQERAVILATALAGPSSAQPAETERVSRPEHLFGRQLAGLDEATLLIQGVGREIERALKTLG
jgi:hypothetical protein